METLTEEFDIKCTICEEHFDLDESDKRPYVMNCGHTVCRECFATLPHCPTCRSKNKASSQNSSGLTASVNYALEGLIALHNLQRGKRPRVTTSESCSDSLLG